MHRLATHRLAAALSLTLALTAALPLHAEDQRPLSGEEFEAYSQGKTLTYAAGGATYGIEQYLPGRKVRWAFVGDACEDGTWFSDGQAICFEYVGVDGLQCWNFFLGPQGLTARFIGDADSEPLVAVEESTEPLKCQGPSIGV